MCANNLSERMFFEPLVVMKPPDPSPERYTAISVGFAYGCALTEAGEAVCWKEEGVIAARPDPASGRYAAVSDGTFNTCALTEDGEAVCWGSNRYGKTEPPLGRYASISAGYDHTCALTEEGGAVCWGANRLGQTERRRAATRRSARVVPHLRSDRDGRGGLLGRERARAVGPPAGPLHRDQRRRVAHLCRDGHGRGCLLGRHGVRGMARPPLGASATVATLGPRECTAAVPAAHRLRASEGQQLLPVQRLRGHAERREQDRGGDHPRRGRRPVRRLHRPTTPRWKRSSRSAPASSRARSTRCA